MPYYGAGDYYRGGDYYQAGGLFSGIGKALGGIARTAAGLLPGPAGVAARAVVGALGGSKSTALARLDNPPVVRSPGVGGFISRILPGGETGYEVDLSAVMGKRRRMNVANAKALRRALRRVAGFGKLARRARRDIGRAATAVGARRTMLRKAGARR